MRNTKVAITKYSTIENLYKFTQNITDTMHFQIMQIK
jgi:hypothetical protein